MPASKKPRKRKPRVITEKERMRRDNQSDIDALYRDCMGLLAAAAKTSDVLQQPIIWQHPQIPRAQLLQASQVLLADLTRMRQELEQIHATCNQWVAQMDPRDPDHHINMLNIGQSYQDWMDIYTQSVLPTLEDVQDMIIPYLNDTQTPPAQ